MMLWNYYYFLKCDNDTVIMEETVLILRRCILSNFAMTVLYLTFRCLSKCCEKEIKKIGQDTKN